jgi:hypothetical protein
MIQRIRDLLRAAPFAPFKIKTSDGAEYFIATSDHAAVTPNNARVLIFDDHEKQITLSGLHIIAVEESAQSVQ